MDPVVTRSLHLDCSAGQAWTSLATARGLAGWLGDEVDLEVVVGAAGTVRAGDAVRRLVVTEVAVGRGISFTWWDEHQPEVASTVTISVRPDADAGDGCTVIVTERLGAAAPALASDASVADLVGVERRWDDRLAQLVGERSLARVAPTA